MKYLIAGLGNIGPDYVHTRHNIGFDVADALAKSLSTDFTSGKKVWIAEGKLKGRQVHIIKPTTYMNLSGEAIRYWLQELKIPKENLLVVTDDLALPFGTLRMKPSGSAAGHNGLTNIIECLQTEQFARLRFGIGNNYPKGKQVDYVLGHWTTTESADLVPRVEIAVEMIKSFVSAGLALTMNTYNNK
ncbi:MAG: aminoacyl-tRNA hydrolase [Bacteroidota bacterium]|jgi:PTH1 family peptidyl-tRNA hydrolase